MNNLRRLDLNLLVTLDALLAEHNVTRAAQRLNFSQPAVSVHLAKLRAIFDDPLLLPGPRGMRPTARAEQLREPLRQALAALELAVTPATPFDPAVAPGTRLAVLETAPSRIAKLAEQGEIDLAFHTREGAPPGLRQRTLFSERYVLVGRVGHPKLHENLTLAQFCQLEQVMVSPDGGGFYGITDRALADLGLTRRVVLSVPHFLFVISVLTQSDLVAMLPERLVRNQPLLQQLEPPLAVPGFEMTMLWHERSHRDPAHRWLREHIVRSV
ncbi:bacterial regulatory helix-turn-helix, lysR family protein [Serratia ureilytica]|uniref:LysR family transcriptional regulator n=1 Tax=Serratia ureilytica TaxID=300181 RepID=UPI000627B412|nr:LysR family transcriptional regulator [Serratia ureilytica]KKO58696.1 bacterial regulatory helix-turn-helix, lysR family protein [Serratia ureilytica]